MAHSRWIPLESNPKVGTDHVPISPLFTPSIIHHPPLGRWQVFNSVRELILIRTDPTSLTHPLRPRGPTVGVRSRPTQEPGALS